MPEPLRLRWLGMLVLLACLFPAEVRADDRQTIGHSVDGRPIALLRDGAPTPALKVLVVGDIHGDEAAGMRIARRLIAGAAPPRTVLLVVPTINPDGLAADTRGNARGVDLNRNFPFRWRPLGGGEYSGTGPLSEPESRAAHRLILREKPDLTIWFHQPFGLIDKPEGNPFAARRFAQLIGLPLVRLHGPYPGSASRWQNHHFPNSTAFVAELPRHVSGSLVKRGTAAVRTLAAELASPELSGRVASPLP
ncbi:MAG TPA: M14 family zinc carboxypeptidase [Solirubrobacterales bacterium]|nr:M14 family zinc carboxypeptidase [Solirubrobacterales bacterium]